MDMMIHKMKALGDSNRFRIVMMLRKRPLCVCELLAVLDIAGGTMSSHLKILKNAELITQQKDGKWIEYGLDHSSSNLIKNIASQIKNTKQIKADSIKIGQITRDICSTPIKKI